jgi:TPR repeat protein
LPFSIEAQQPPYRQEFNAELAHDDAIQAMRDGNYAVAFCIWYPLARNGDAQAEYSLGWMYHNGYGLKIDDERAFNWWLRAAARGSTDAHHALGELYASGQGVEKNLPIALGWYISATLKGHELARETLVSMLTDSNPQIQKIFQQILKSDWSILGTPMQVRVDRANTRSGPGKEFEVIHVLEKGHEVLPMKSEGDWIKVGISGLGTTAWVFHTLLAPAPGIYSVE